MNVSDGDASLKEKLPKRHFLERTYCLGREGILMKGTTETSSYRPNKQ